MNGLQGQDGLSQHEWKGSSVASIACQLHPDAVIDDMQWTALQVFISMQRGMKT